MSHIPDNVIYIYIYLFNLKNIKESLYPVNGIHAHGHSDLFQRTEGDISADNMVIPYEYDLWACGTWIVRTVDSAVVWKDLLLQKDRWHLNSHPLTVCAWRGDFASAPAYGS